METSITVVTPASSYNFLTLAEAKTWLSVTDSTQDSLIQALIDQQSSMISVLCNRVFGREHVIETFWDIASPRVYLSRYPVLQADIVSVMCGDVEIVDYVLDEESGKLTLTAGAYPFPIVVEYTGGYNLPSAAPKALKYALSLLAQERYAISGSSSSGGISGAGGIRMIAHKESRIMYYQATESTSSSSGSSSGGGTAAMRAVENLLSHFTRIWV